jgi:hypothetical protein
MDKLNNYRNIVKQILSQHAECVPSHGQIATIPIFDERNDHYLLLDIGWDRTGRVHAVGLPICLRENKVWVEKDGTETGVTQALLEAGVPKEDIVLGFYRPA